jgi:hypothetical protein
MSKRKKHLEVIEKRIRCLELRIKNETTSETPSQKAERDALKWLLEIEAQRIVTYVAPSNYSPYSIQ